MVIFGFHSFNGRLWEKEINSTNQQQQKATHVESVNSSFSHKSTQFDIVQRKPYNFYFNPSLAKKKKKGKEKKRQEQVTK